MMGGVGEWKERLHEGWQRREERQMKWGPALSNERTTLA